MAKNKSGGGLGKALMKDRRKGRRGKGDEGWLHTSELSDGYEWSRLNLTSVTEENSLDEFLRTAELAGTEFTAEKRNISVVMDTDKHTGLPGAEERREIVKLQETLKQDLRIPRRPKWDETTTPEQLELKEREGFLEWRRHLASLEEKDKIILTPFEKNLEFWRQLWRVIERSDVLVQIVDARNPLLFYCKDLETYVKEVDSKKVNLLLMNKSDLLSDKQREMWFQYFKSQVGFEAVAFWSAKPNDVQNIKESLDDEEKSLDDEDKSLDDDDKKSLDDDDDDKKSMDDDKSVDGYSNSDTDTDPNTATSDTAGASVETGRGGVVGGAPADVTEEDCCHSNDAKGSYIHSSKLLTREQLIELFTRLAPDDKRPVTVGLAGYPNVGKSSTINSLMGTKRVPVSATPGRTKHFQTLHVTKDLVLCDCPGLVFPNFITTKAQLICSGILPIDQMRDHVPPVSMVCQRVPRPVLERCYGIMIQRPVEGEDPSRSPFAHELLSAYGYSRGFMTSHGLPDQSRSARYILKDFVNGKLLYCEPPPGTDPVAFNDQLIIEDKVEPHSCQSTKGTAQITDTPKFDEVFFEKRQGTVHSKGVVGVAATPLAPDGDARGGAKPWKKHHNYKKKEKTRRVIGDQTPYSYY